MRRIASGVRLVRLATPEHLKSCAPQALSPLQAPSLIPVQHCRAEQEMQRLSPSRRGTAVPGLQQLPSLDSLMTSKSVDGLSELARAPDSPPTGKTLEHFKERVCCTATSERVKKKIAGFRSFVFNRVQLIHRRVPNNLCNLRGESCSQAIGELAKISLCFVKAA
jgi:hypothetical protein